MGPGAGGERQGHGPRALGSPTGTHTPSNSDSEAERDGSTNVPPGEVPLPTR